jgi:protein-disulfide isomerase
VRFVLGAACLLLALAASFMLALDHFAIARPPGCGPGSGCDQAARSAWGRIPGVDWPVSLLGVAYFGAMLLAWLLSRGTLHAIVRGMIGLSIVGSVVFTFVMFRNGYLCKYCLAVHAANLAFAACALLPSRAGTREARTNPLAAWIVTFIALTGALAVVNAQTSSRRQAKAESERQQSMSAIAATAERRPSHTGSATQATDNATPFTGRYRLGPENAPIRIVMFFDYQCSDCKIMESQAMALLRSRQDVSLSVKHFPMNTLCNPYATDLHRNACWAARAAEAAGMLRGNDGFWQMHAWLFSQSGEFTDASLPARLQQLGYDPQQFIETMSAQATLDLVKADIEEGVALGLHYTPMIFINGVELRGFIGNPGALARSVNELAARNPPPGSPAQDQPALALEKYVGDWLAQPVQTLPQRNRTWAIGPEDAKAQFVVWGDYQEPNCAALDRLLRDKVAAGRSVRYVFRHYPFDKACNPTLPRTMFPFGCMAARAAEAAGVLGGNEAYWKMHAWLFANQVPLDDAALRAAAAAAQFDPAALLGRMNEAEVQNGVNEDIDRAVPFVRQGIPAVYLNGRWLPRWRLEGTDVLDRLITAAEGR